MSTTAFDSPAAWTAEDLRVDQSWIFRLWLATPEGERLPESWRAAYRAIEPRTVRGGIRGPQYDELRKSFEARQAASLSMVATD